MTTLVSQGYFLAKAESDVLLKKKIVASLSRKDRDLLERARNAAINDKDFDGVIVHADGRVSIRIK